MKKLLSFSFLFLIIFSFSCSEPTSTGSGESGDNDDSNGNDRNFSHTEITGSSADAFLSGVKFETLRIEVDYVRGYRPSQIALDGLTDFLEQRLNKPDGIIIELSDEITDPGTSGFTADQISQLEQEYRDQFTEGNVLSAYIIILNDQYSQANVLGVAYLNTSLALFGETIQNNSGGLTRPSAETIENIVLRHEFGHLFGLVDNGTPAIQNHVDKQNGAHCTEDSCLMYWAIQTTDLINNIVGEQIPELDSQCLQDLQANGGK